MMPWFLVGGGAVLAVVAGIVWLTHGGQSSTDPARAVLVLDWPADERDDAAVYIGDRRREMAESGPLEFSLRPGDHRVVMLRRGYERIEQTVSLEAGQRETRRPEWVLSQPDAEEDETPAIAQPQWLDDFETAKQLAVAQRKDVLLVFEEYGANRTAGRLRNGLLSQREFRQQIDWRFVLVLVEFAEPPDSDEPESDSAHNAKRQLAESFHLPEFPAVVLTDAEGLPYAIDELPLRGSVQTLVSRLARFQGIREQRDALFLRIERAEDEDKLEAIEEAASLLAELELAAFYEVRFDAWQTVVDAQDPENAKGAVEALFELRWTGRLAALDEENIDEINATIAELDDWKTRYEFRDPDRAALMHLRAAARLIETDQSDEAGKYVEQARDYEPEDLHTIILLAQIEAIVGHGGGGTGTGFAVAGDGFILTNHHVIEGNRKTSVRLPDHEDLVPAEVIADDPERDIALLKIELPEDVEMAPLQIARAEVGRGAGVGAFGFPGGDSIGTGLKLTIGIVSAGPEQNEEKMYLLDCRINPGNSGGPLCDTHGNVVGMVTAKIGGYGIDSYGMALPGADLDDFLKKNLPEYPSPRPPSREPARLEWDEIDQLVSPSVVMIIGE